MYIYIIYIYIYTCVYIGGARPRGAQHAAGVGEARARGALAEAAVACV